MDHDWTGLSVWSQRNKAKTNQDLQTHTHTHSHTHTDTHSSAELDTCAGCQMTSWVQLLPELWEAVQTKSEVDA